MPVTTAFHALNDPHDPIVHDKGGSIEAARPHMVARALKFVAKLKETNPEHAARFCEHGQYVGYQGALRFKCPLCNVNGDL